MGRRRSAAERSYQAAEERLENAPKGEEVVEMTVRFHQQYL
jgi:hypothetical protein